MKRKKLLVFIVSVLIAAMALSACKSKKEEPKEAEPKKEEEELDDDNYETFETLLQNLAEGLNEGNVLQMKEAFVGGDVPAEFLTVSGNYILEFELMDIFNDVILEGDEIEQTLMEGGLIEEEYEEYTKQATKACILEITIKQTTISDNSVKSNDGAMMLALKIDGKWAVVPWI